MIILPLQGLLPAIDDKHSIAPERRLPKPLHPAVSQDKLPLGKARSSAEADEDAREGPGTDWRQLAG